MSDQESLFGDLLNDGEGVAAAPPASLVLSQWRVDQLRAALDKRGLVSMLDRRRAVEAIVGHPVANLRELTVSEATRVLEALRGGVVQRGTSSWDDREEATWIDRL